jgi:hypothetical protein
MDIEARRGDTETYDLAITDRAGDPVNLTGSTVWFTAKRHTSDADDDAIITATQGDGLEITNAAQGELTLTLQPDDTSGLEDRLVRLEYDVQLKDGTGRITTPLTGKLYVHPDVRRATT